MFMYSMQQYSKIMIKWRDMNILDQIIRKEENSVIVACPFQLSGGCL